MDLLAKIKTIGAKECLTKIELRKIAGLSISSWKKYEAGVTDMGLQPSLKVAS